MWNPSCEEEVNSIASEINVTRVTVDRRNLKLHCADVGSDRRDLDVCQNE